MPKYNHEKKAGNLGDVFKHPLLICCLETILKQNNKQKPFVYVDLFSAYPYVKLRNNKQQEWKNGVTKFFDESGNIKQFENRYIQTWLNGITLPKNDEMGHYPGSIEIAHKILRSSNLEYRIYANDLGDEETKQLHAYAAGANNEADKKRIIVTQKKAQCIDLSELKPDFVFIDPPNISESMGYTPNNYIEQIQQIKTAQFLTWVPAFPEDQNKINNLENGVNNQKRLSVRWAEDGGRQKSVGCHLLYRTSEQIEEQIEKTFKVLINEAPNRPRGSGYR